MSEAKTSRRKINFYKIPHFGEHPKLAILILSISPSVAIQVRNKRVEPFSRGKRELAIVSGSAGFGAKLSRVRQDRGNNETLSGSLFPHFPTPELCLPVSRRNHTSITASCPAAPDWCSDSAHILIIPSICTLSIRCTQE